jgi:hypothetical protein
LLLRPKGATLNDVASHNAKTSRLAFIGDATPSSVTPTEMTRDLADKWFRALYGQLEVTRLEQRIADE